MKVQFPYVFAVRSRRAAGLCALPRVPCATVAPMTPIIVSSVAHGRRLERARAWLEGRGQSEELLVVGATLDGANELARVIASGKGVTFGWHRLGVSQLAFA